MSEEQTKQPWEALGFNSFADYEVQNSQKIATLTDAVSTLAENFNKVYEKPAPTEQKQEIEEEQKVDDFKAKTATLYASLSTAQREKLEVVSKELDAEVIGLISGDEEARYSFIKEATSGETIQPSGLFADLIVTPKKDVNQMIRENLQRITGKAPDNSGAGFIPASEAVQIEVEKKHTYNPIGGFQS